MLISFSWLKNYINLPDSVTPEEVADKLKMSTVEVEKIIHQGEELKGIVLGKVLTCTKHPDADKLQVCEVDVGSINSDPSTGKLQIVCGGSNVTANMLVAVATIGAQVHWHGEPKPVVMAKTKIRGVESSGMICAAEEIGLGEIYPKNSEKEILDMSAVILSKAKDLSSQKDKKVGTPLAEVLNLNDTVLEVDNKSLSNRPDLWGHYGLAREVAVLFRKKLKVYKTANIKPGKEFKINVKVEDTKLCPRYLATALSGVEIKESPEWLKQRLAAVGLRPINNIVDITNFVMLDLGQPLHAFDARQLETVDKNSADKTIIVRHAGDSEKFITLDGSERILNSSDLVIADEIKPVALAGVMGGQNSEILNDTKTVIFESANFNPAAIRRTSSRLGLRTDSSARFEKSLDPINAEIALRRAVELTLECCPKAKVVSNVVDVSNYSLATGPINLSLDFVKQKLGVAIEQKEIIKILESLGFEISIKKENLSIVIPSWRATKDISLPEDLVEEIARVYGYSKIESALPEFKIIPPTANNLRILERQVIETVVRELGYNEVYNYSFVSGEQIKKLGDNLDKYLELDNPLSKEKPWLRRNLLPNLLENVAANLNNFDEVKIVESGKVFLVEEPGVRISGNSDELLPKQDVWLTAVYAAKKNTTPFWEAKRMVEFLNERLNVNLTLNKEAKILPYEHPGRVASVFLGVKEIGVLYELNPAVQNNYNISAKVAILEINLSAWEEIILSNQQNISDKKYEPLSNYPESTRDVAFVVDNLAAHKDIAQTLKNLSPLIKKVELFDVYQGANVGDGKKSMAYRLTYGSSERTLTSAEIDTVQADVIKLLQQKFSASVRQ